MAYVNSRGYVCRNTAPGRPTISKSSTRNWWLPRWDGRGRLVIGIQNIKIRKSLADKYAGKRIKLKLVVEE